MRIRPEQLDALQSAAVRRLAEQWLPRLREHFPAELARLGGLDDEPALRHTSAGIARGLKYGILIDANLYRFVIARLALGDDFDSDPSLPWVRQLLEDETIATGARMDALITLAIYHCESAAREGAE